MMRKKWNLLLCLHLMNLAVALAAPEQIARLQAAHGMLPLKKTAVDVDITGNIAYTTVRQTYINNTEAFMEAVYSHPLPAGAIVTGMTLNTPRQTIRSVVKEKADAVITYQQARKTGRAAALMEQQKENVFTTSIANIDPGGEVEVIFSYVEQLAFDGYGYALTFPTTFGPRVAAPTNHTEDQMDPVAVAPSELTNDPSWNLTPVKAFTDHFLDMTVQVSGLPIRDIFSNTHDVWVEEVDDEVYQVSLNNDMEATDRDFVLKLDLFEGTSPRLSVVRSQDRNGAHGLLSVFPPLAQDPDFKAVRREVVFVMDISGSMMGDPIEQAKAGLVECLGMLHPDDHFNIIPFNNQFTAYSPDFVEASDTNLQQAKGFVDRLVSGGSTWMKGPLRHALTMPGTKDYLRIVVFLTDGDINYGSELIDLVKAEQGDARLFSFGVGAAPNAFLLRKLSETGSGLANFIHQDEDIAEVMSDFFSTINAPVLTHVTVEFLDEWGAPMTDISVFPAKAPDVFRDRPLQLTFLQQDPRNGLVRLNGMLGDQAVSYEYPLADTQPTPLEGVRHFYGQAVVNDLMAQWHEVEALEDKDELRDHVVAAALDYQLVTRFTARVATSEVRSRPEDAEMIRAQGAVTAKRNALAPPPFAATADGDPARLVLGLILLTGGLAALIRVWILAEMGRRRARIIVQEVR